MKRKNVIFSTLFLLASMIPGITSAQSMYLSIDAGYGTKLSPQNNSWYYTNVDYIGSVYTSERVNFSLGQGFKAGISFGYGITDNISLEIGAYYFGGSPCSAHYIRVDSATPYTNMNYEFSAEMIRINPSLQISAGDGKAQPYAKFGTVISRGSMTEIHDGISSGDDLHIEYRYNKGIAIGLSAALGTTFRFNDKWSLFGELSMVNMSYSPNKRTTVAYTENGVDQLPYMTASQIDVEYVDRDEFDFNNQPPQSEPSKWLKENYSLSNVGINVGLRIYL